jgi:hypothetical protein
MIATYWQAWLFTPLFLHLLLAPLGRNATLRLVLLGVALALAFVPVKGLPLALFIRSFVHDPSVSLLVLLAALMLQRLNLVRLDHLRLGDVKWVYATLALVLYPASLGLSYVDPYAWGFEPAWLLLAMALLALALLLRGSWLCLAMLLLATLAYALRGDGPGNYWNYLIDPLVALYALLGCLCGVLAAVGRCLARLRRSASFETLAEVHP